MEGSELPTGVRIATQRVHTFLVSFLEPKRGVASQISRKQRVLPGWGEPGAEEARPPPSWDLLLLERLGEACAPCAHRLRLLGGPLAVGREHQPLGKTVLGTGFWKVLILQGEHSQLKFADDSQTSFTASELLRSFGWYQALDPLGRGCQAWRGPLCV